MKSQHRMAQRIGVPVALLGLSVIAHTLVLQHVGMPGTPPEILSNSDTMEVVMIEAVKVETVPMPTPEPTPLPTPESTPEPTPPPVEEILTTDDAEAAPTPVPTPTPKATSTPKPKQTPKPKPVTPSEASKRPPTPNPQPPAAPRGKMVEARPDVASNPPPRYPDLARRNGWEGEVIIRADVDASGRVTSAAVIRKSRYAVLDQAALAAVRKWKFKPRTVGGQRVDATVEVPVNFTLRR